MVDLAKGGRNSTFYWNKVKALCQRKNVTHGTFYYKTGYKR
jgi:hypothetical protein